MNTHYISPEEIKKMTQTECIEKLQEIIFEHRQKMPQGDFKTGLDILKKLYERNKLVQVFFLLLFCFGFFRWISDK